MPTRSRTTFKKRQKELARMEKQRDQAARRMQRKLQPSEPDTGATDEVTTDEAATSEGPTDDLLPGLNAEPSAKSL